MNDELAEHMGAYGGSANANGAGYGTGSASDGYGSGSYYGRGHSDLIGHSDGKGTGVNGYPGTYFGSGELTTYR